MFSGIVEEIGVVQEASPAYLVIEAVKVLEGVEAGDSMAVNGACLTVTCLSGGGFRADIMPETLRCTNLGGLHYGDKVNLERAMQLGARLGGHLVLGHVDDTGRVVSVVVEEAARIMRISAPAAVMPYVADKGFIAVDGTSLTVVSAGDSSFTVSLVAHTLASTTLGHRKPGDEVNLEVDVVARYLGRINGHRSQGLTLESLEADGFARRGS